MNITSLDRFFGSTNAKLDMYDEFRKIIAPQIAPDFNMVKCLNPDERRLSAIIAMLLDPKGEHGQRDQFLKLFLDVIKCDGITWNESILSLEVPTTHIEKGLRFIDIVLSLDDFDLAFENKPWAGDLDQQVEDYLDELRNRGNRSLLIYLSPNGEDPQENSISEKNKVEAKKNNELKIISYKEIREWCEMCMRVCRSARVRAFLEDFRDYLASEFCGGGNIMDVDFLIEHSTKFENIRAAASIGLAWPRIAESLIQKLAVYVYKELSLDPNEWEQPKSDFNIGERYTGFQFQKTTWNNYRFRFEFDLRNACGFLFGICKKDEKLPDFKENLPNKFAKKKIGLGQASSWWPWWKYFDKPFRDWGSDDRPWAGITEDGETVRLIAATLRNLIDVCEQEVDRKEAELNFGNT